MAQTPETGKRTVWMAVGAIGVLAIGGLLIVPRLMVPNAQESATCSSTPGEAACRFLGAPLEVEGVPVFLPPKQQAFFPTKGQLSFIDAEGRRWIAPPKTLTDGATIPIIFAPLIGDRQAREYVLAAAMHDAYCGIGNDAVETYHTRPWHEVHRMFYEALLVGGTPPHKARVMYAAVYLGGPRWDDPSRDLSHVSNEALILEMAWCLHWIDNAEPTVDQIERWMKMREAGLINGTQTEPDWDKLFTEGV